jgi:histidine triad (HIT) family protein
MSSIFNKIINKEIPAYIVAEDAFHIAFLDVRPIARGHVLCIPKTEIDYIFDLNDVQFTALQLFSKKVALGMKKAIECKKIGIAVIGLEVPHAHIHLVPMNDVRDMCFTKERCVFTEEEYQEIRKSIAEAISL